MTRGNCIFIIKTTEFYVNRTLIKSASGSLTKLDFNLNELENIKDTNELIVIIYDQNGSKTESSVTFKVGIASSTPN